VDELADKQQPAVSYVPDTAPLVCSCSDDGTMKVWCQLERALEATNQEEKDSSEAAGIDDGSYRRTKLAMVGSTGGEGFSNGRSAYCVAWCPPYSHPAPEGVSNSTLLTSDIVVVATADDSLCFFKLSRNNTPAAPGSADEASNLVSVAPIASCSAAHEGEVNCVAFAPHVLPTNSLPQRGPPTNNSRSLA
jgi:WD40 repeat protein